MSSGPARYEVSGERRKPKPSCSTSRVPSPKMASPFLAWDLRSAKTSSCLRRRFAPSSSLVFAISTSSETCFSFRSDKCMPRGTCQGEKGFGRARETTRAGEAEALGGFGRSSERPKVKTGYRILDVAVNEGRQLRLGNRAHLGSLEVAVLEEHQRGNPANAVLGRGGLVLVDVELGHLQAALVFAGDLVERRSDHLARTAPLRPVVHEDG